MLNEIDLSRADLNLLVLFEAVLAERHVGRAAARLHLTPSAVSHGLGRLRQLLNDPLFLRTPKGVIPSARALELALPMADILARARSLMASAAPFDPRKSKRRFSIGTPDAVSSVLLMALLDNLKNQAPLVDICLRQVLPAYGEPVERAWQQTFADLESRSLDIAIIPSERIPARFEQRCVYQEDFVIVARVGHPFLRKATLEKYCEMEHLVVSQSGDPHGFVDDLLAKQKLTRRIALTVPSFMFALSVIAETDLITAVPRRLAAMHQQRFGIESVQPPLALPHFRMNAVASKSAMMDAGVAWMYGLLRTPPDADKRPRPRPGKRIKRS